jgi:hypothetical protein
MSSYFYGLVQQRGPWATTDVDILRLTQPRVTQSVVGARRSPPENRPISGVLAGNAGYGIGASTAWTRGDSLNGIVPAGEGLPAPTPKVPTTTPGTPSAPTAPSIAPASAATDPYNPIPKIPNIVNPFAGLDPSPSPFASTDIISKRPSYRAIPLAATDFAPKSIERTQPKQTPH